LKTILTTQAGLINAYVGSRLVGSAFAEPIFVVQLAPIIGSTREDRFDAGNSIDAALEREALLRGFSRAWIVLSPDAPRVADVPEQSLRIVERRFRTRPRQQTQPPIN
jgi:hypothetical protein